MTNGCEAVMTEQESMYRLRVAEINAKEPYKRRIMSHLYAVTGLTGKIWNRMDKEARMEACDRLGITDRDYVGMVNKDWEDMTERRKGFLYRCIDTSVERERIDRMYGMTSTGWIWSNPAAMEARA